MKSKSLWACEHQAQVADDCEPGKPLCNRTQARLDSALNAFFADAFACASEKDTTAEPRVVKKAAQPTPQKDHPRARIGRCKPATRRKPTRAAHPDQRQDAPECAAVRTDPRNRSAPSWQQTLRLFLAQAKELARSVERRLLGPAAEAVAQGRSGLVLTRRWCRLGPILEQAVETVERCHHRSVSLYQDTYASGWWDKDYLVCAFTNLLQYALTHSEDHQAVCVLVIPRESQVVVTLFVEGLTALPTTLPCERDTSLADKTTASPGGLPFLLLERVAQAHGGTLRIRTIEAGTQFSLALPQRFPNVLDRIDASDVRREAAAPIARTDWEADPVVRFFPLREPPAGGDN